MKLEESESESARATGVGLRTVKETLLVAAEEVDIVGVDGEDGWPLV